MPAPIPAKFKPLMTLVKKITGKPGLALDLEQAKAFKAKDPETYSNYLALRKEFNAAWHQKLKSIVGSKPKPYPQVYTALEDAGFSGVLPQGFTGLIDAEGNFFTVAGEPIDGKPTVTNFPSVKMNPEPDDSDSHWIFQGIRPDGGAGAYFYTAEFNKHQSQVKFEKVRNLNLPAIRKRWLPKVKKFDPKVPQCIGSLILEILYQFTARIGTPGNSTLGISTLRVRNAKKTTQGISLSYLGKDSVKTVHKLLNSNPEHKIVIAALLPLIEDEEKKPTDNIFMVDTGDKFLKVTPAYVNRLWRACGGGDTTVHKIRTYTATHLFVDSLETAFAGSKRPKNQREAAALFKALAEKVGKVLNHVKRGSDGSQTVTGATALKSYIDAEAQIMYWRTLGLQLPKYLQKVAEGSGAAVAPAS